jgi:hypothetical protein
MSRNKTCSNGFQVCPIFPFEYYCYLFFPFTLHKSGTSIAFYIICRVNCISVLVRFLASSAVDCWFEPWSGQTKEYKIDRGRTLFILGSLPLYRLIIYIDRRILWCTHFLFSISWWEQVNFQWNNDEIRFVLDQHVKLDIYSASSLKQQSTDRHVTPLGNIILILSQPVFNIQK